MPDFSKQLEEISKLRSDRRRCEQDLYTAKLQRHHLQDISKRRDSRETVEARQNFQQIESLQRRIRELETQATDLNKIINRNQAIIHRSRHSQKSLEILNQRLARKQGLYQESEQRLAELENSDQAKPAMLRKLKEAMLSLQDSIEQDQELRRQTERNLEENQHDVQQALTSQEQSLVQKDQQIDTLKDTRGQMTELLSPNFYPEVATELEEAQNSIKRLTSDLKDCDDQLNQAIVDFYEQLHPRQLINNLDGSIPFLLFPVRLETRFVGNELWLRIFPDDIAVHTHEKILTDKEVLSGEDYWRKLLEAQDDAEKRAAWMLLSELYGSFRASWVAQSTKPENFEEAVEPADLSFPVQDVVKKNAWTNAPRTTIMPDRFAIYLHQGEQVFEYFTKFIPDTLYLGPDPLDEDGSFDTSSAQHVKFNDAFAWLQDFDEAIEKGMGLKIPLPDDLLQGIEKIEAMGIYMTASAVDSKGMLEALLDNHHYGQEGFALLPTGTPTNNTEHNQTSYSEQGPDSQTGYFTEAGPPLFDPSRLGDEETDGHRLATAMGIDYSTLQHVQNANKRDYQEASDLNAALYSATLGYYFESMMNPVISESIQGKIREFFVSNVVGRGPFSGIRVGDQPYGILLTTDFTRWKNRPENDQDTVFLDKTYEILQHLQAVWESAAADLSWFGKPGQDWDQVLMDILGLHPSSVTFHQRVGYSTEYLKNLQDFQWGGKYFSDYFENVFDQFTNLNLFKSFGYAPDSTQSWSEQAPQILKIIYQHYALLLDARNLVDKVPLSEHNVLPPIAETIPNYIQWLHQQDSIEELERQDFGEGVAKPNSLLYLMLRKALLLELHRTSSDWLSKNKVPVPQAHDISNFYNIRSQGDLTKWETMRAEVSMINPELGFEGAVADNLLNFNLVDANANNLQKVRTAMSRLADLPTARLERILTEHLDSCSYRLDAWQTGLMYQRFWESRNQSEAGNAGIYLGAYGYLEDLVPNPSRTRLDPQDLPASLRPQDQGDIFQNQKNGGFVHAPSIQQAATASLLRSGYLSHASTETADLLSVNLSSGRIRKSLFLLEGLRAGIRLELLLGYQFERGLHDRSSFDTTINLDQYILDFREKFPVKQHAVPQKGSEEVPTEEDLLLPVLNGLALAELQDPFPYGISALFSLSNDERQAVIAEKDNLENALDALKDLLTAESVFQLTNGNFERAGAMLNSLKEGQIPAEIEVLNTPRSSQFTFTNRIALHFEVLDPIDPASNPWPVSMTPRAMAEPGINRWLAQQLGDPANIVFVASHLVHDQELGDQVLDEQKYNLQVLGLQPLDLVYILGNELQTGASELETRIADHFKLDRGLEQSSEIRITFDTDQTVGAEQPFGAKVPLIRYLKELIVNSRPSTAQDYVGNSKKYLSSTDNPSGYDTAESKTRVENILNLWELKITELGAVELAADVNGTIANTVDDLHNALISANSELAAVEVSLTDLHANGLRLILEALSKFGLAEAYPVTSISLNQESKQALLSQALSVYGRALETQARIHEKLSAALAVSSEAEAVPLLSEVMDLLLGEAFAFLPTFYYHNGADIDLSHQDEDQLLAYSKSLGKTFPIEEWVQSISHVQPRILNFELVRSLIEASEGHTLDLQVVQVPYRVKDHWLALEFPEVDEITNQPFQINHDTLSLIIHGASAFSVGQVQSGLVLDDWSEVIPSSQEVTGIAFNYDQPNATPPQALLLVTPPEVRDHWEWEDLTGAMRDTLNRARLRAVEPAMIDKTSLNVLLPALISDFTSHDLNISLDYSINVPEVMQFLSENIILRFFESNDNG